MQNARISLGSLWMIQDHPAAMNFAWLLFCVFVILLETGIRWMESSCSYGIGVSPLALLGPRPLDTLLALWAEASKREDSMAEPQQPRQVKTSHDCPSQEERSCPRSHWRILGTGARWSSRFGQACTELGRRKGWWFAFQKVGHGIDVATQRARRALQFLGILPTFFNCIWIYVFFVVSALIYYYM